jgi:hypothetical protein
VVLGAGLVFGGLLVRQFLSSGDGDELGDLLTDLLVSDLEFLPGAGSFGAEKIPDLVDLMLLTESKTSDLWPVRASVEGMLERAQLPLQCSGHGGRGLVASLALLFCAELLFGDGGRAELPTTEVVAACCPDVPDDELVELELDEEPFRDVAGGGGDLLEEWFLGGEE